MKLALLIIYLESLYQLHTPISLKCNVELERICVQMFAEYTEFSALNSHDSFTYLQIYFMYITIWK
jgi:hypothetical protein